MKPTGGESREEFERDLAGDSGNRRPVAGPRFLHDPTRPRLVYTDNTMQFARGPGVVALVYLPGVSLTATEADDALLRDIEGIVQRRDVSPNAIQPNWRMRRLNALDHPQLWHLEIATMGRKYLTACGLKYGLEGSATVDYVPAGACVRCLKWDT